MVGKGLMVKVFLQELSNEIKMSKVFRVNLFDKVGNHMGLW